MTFALISEVGFSMYN
ncbi:hypothetical protein, partial [Clostridium neonatale]